MSVRTDRLDDRQLTEATCALEAELMTQLPDARLLLLRQEMRECYAALTDRGLPYPILTLPLELLS